MWRMIKKAPQIDENISKLIEKKFMHVMVKLEGFF